METAGNEIKKEFIEDSNIEDIELQDGIEVNPWSVENAEIFLQYCCPECDFKIKEKQDFSKHALENHTKSRTLFKDKVDNLVNVKVTLATKNDRHKTRKKVKKLTEKIKDVKLKNLLQVCDQNQAALNEK